MAAQRIDFKFVKEQADFLAVLRHYGIEILGQGVSRTIRCPFHADKKASCKINLGRKIYHCFGCESKGNILQFVLIKEGLDEKDLRGAARTLAKICGIPTAPPAESPAKAEKTPLHERSGAETTNRPSDPSSPAHEAPTASETPPQNKPLEPDFVERFEGKLLREHEYLIERELYPELAAHFGLGVFPPSAKGMMRNRLCIPIYNEAGVLLAYAGRWVGDDDELPEGEEKYKLPKGFHKSQVLFNLHRVQGKKHLVVVEGFFSVFRLHALGVPAVALMGRTLSERQIDLLLTSRVRFLTFLLDGDAAGRSAAHAIMEQLCHQSFRVKFALLPEGEQPDTVDPDYLRELLSLR